MLRKVLISLVIMCILNHPFAQQPSIINIANECSTANLKKNLYYLASDKMEGRMMASHGDTLASLFVADEFKKANLIAPYFGSYFQTISATKKTLESQLKFGEKKYEAYDGWHIFPLIPVSLNNVPIIYNQFTDLNTLINYINNTDVKGKAITICQPVMYDAFDNNIDSLEAVWKLKGMVAIVWYGDGPARTINYFKVHKYIPDYKNDLLDPVFEPNSNKLDAMAEISFTPGRINDLLAANNIKINGDGSFADSLQQPVLLKNKLSISVKMKTSEVQAPNIIGVWKGSDTTLPCIVLSAHHDHDGKNGNKIYYGAVDNASGTVAIIEIADLLNKAAKQNLRPKRTIVFASFTGEERGELGSTYYVNHPLYPLQKTYGVLNIDMMGRVDTFYSGKIADSSYAYFLVKDSLHNFRKSLYAANDALKELKLDARYEDPRYMQRRLQGSDQFPFYLKGVPFVRIDCGFAKDYHQPTDTPDKINYDLLTKQVKLAFVTLWNMANE